MEHQRTQNACYQIEKNFQIFVSEYSGTIMNNFEDALNAYQQLVRSKGFKFDWRQLDNATGLNICSTSSYSYKYIMKALKTKRRSLSLKLKTFTAKQSTTNCMSLKQKYALQFVRCQNTIMKAMKTQITETSLACNALNAKLIFKKSALYPTSLLSTTA
ncbi:Hypothetical_protein [Hexamita inflata]|uniref:Hypothetical_protein n=1 Tax=Hexamita inflata TaxID=28002 RepID=A0AA86URA7_9EUKA|nr:Hypothetical protein HINF_LOCUS49141 [Hexamita inflata]